MNVVSAPADFSARRDRRRRSDAVSADERLVERARSILVSLNFPLVAVAVVYRMTGRFIVVDGDRADAAGREALRVASDPVIAAARRSVRPIPWIGLGSRAQQASLEAAGFRFGVTVPVHGPLGLMVLVSVAGRAFVGSQEALEVPVKLREVGFALLDGVRVGEKDSRGQPLSDTQREALRMIARGHSCREVAQFEGVTDAAVTGRIERAKDALGARSISELVARALVSGELGALHLEGL
jgi:DNA-binding CsgD family transcriptional regulator